MTFALQNYDDSGKTNELGRVVVVSFERGDQGLCRIKALFPHFCHLSNTPGAQTLPNLKY
jgi:hypothetical protein